MRIRQAGRYLTFSAETENERDDLEVIAREVLGLQFRVDSVNSETLALRATGPGDKAGGGKGSEKVADAGPLNITFDETAMPLRLISNLAETPFELDGRRYASVEAFWQGLKIADEDERVTLAELHGHEAKKAGPQVKPGDRISYEGREVVVGTVDHWALMEAANVAKFQQHKAARAALASTGKRPLVHQVTVDSRTIPGIIMADIWMRIRAKIESGE